MLPLRLHVLGTSAARPWPGAPAASALVTRGGASVLLDCGEGTLLRLPPKQLAQRGLDAICVTHMHGDHVYGLPGLLTSMSLAGRTRRLTLLAPPGLDSYLEGVFAASHAGLSFPLDYPTLPSTASTEAVWACRGIEIKSLPLRHRVPAFGFCVSTPPTGRRIRPGVVESFAIPYASIPQLRDGSDWTQVDGSVVPNASLTLPPEPTRSLAYLTDTTPLSAWPEGWLPPDLMVHDATFGPADEHLAQVSGHSTTRQAAAFAKTVGAARLLLTHVSVRYSPEERARMATDAAAAWAQVGQTYEV